MKITHRVFRIDTSVRPIDLKNSLIPCDLNFQFIYNILQLSKNSIMSFKPPFDKKYHEFRLDFVRVTISSVTN